MQLADIHQTGGIAKRMPQQFAHQKLISDTISLDHVTVEHKGGVFLQNERTQGFVCQYNLRKSAPCKISLQFTADEAFVFGAVGLAWLGIRKYKEMLILLNKSDCIADKATFESVQTVFPEALIVSAKTGMNLDQLTQQIAEKVSGRSVRVRVTLSAADGKLQSYLRTVGTELTEEYPDESVQIEVTLGKNQLAHLKRLGAKQIETL